MIFTEFRFLFFFLVVFVVHRRLRDHGMRKLWLLGASILFYSAWNWLYLPVILGTTTIDFIAGREIARTSNARRRKTLLALSLSCNVLILAAFKYSAVFGANWLIPLGISFHTFQGMSYTIDVYRGRGTLARSFTDFCLYIMFFPQLVAGPVVRSSEFLPLLEKESDPRQIPYRRCLVLFLIGYFKKTCVADPLSGFVQNAYASPGSLSVGAAWLAVFAFGFQIYCDFSGYCDMAVAAGGLLGFRLPENFNRPYLSENIRVFWRRWNITISSWFRDYVYIPLGGNRGSRLGTYRNLLITATISGLWHGPGWTFFLWGLLHGCSLVVHRALFSESSERRSNTIVLWLSTVLTCTWACLLFVLFRAPTVAAALAIWKSAAGFSHWAAPGSVEIYPHLLLILIGLAGLHVGFTKLRILDWAVELPEAIFYVLAGSASALILALAYVSYKPFIYFQF